MTEACLLFIARRRGTPAVLESFGGARLLVADDEARRI